jgi:flagellar protein FlaG
LRPLERVEKEDNMVAPISTNAFHFTGITSPGQNPQAAPVSAETNPPVTTTPAMETSPGAQDASRAVTGIREIPQGPEISQIDTNRKQEEPKAVNERTSGGRPKRTSENQEANAKPALVNRDLNYKIYPEINRIQTNVIDQNSKEVIRQIPPDRVIKIARNFQEYLGRMIDKQA